MFHFFLQQIIFPRDNSISIQTKLKLKKKIFFINEKNQSISKNYFQMINVEKNLITHHFHLHKSQSIAFTQN